MSNKRRRAPMLECKDDLHGSLVHAWKMLDEAVTERRAAFHVCTLATVDTNGLPQARSVVLRGCNTEEQWLRFNTDLRTQKAKNIANNPMASMLFYDAYAKVQLRLGVRLKLVESDEKNRLWADTPHYSRECYQVTMPPGQPIESPHDLVFDPSSNQDGDIHFAPVRAHVETLEWLYLAVGGHRRARFDFSGGQAEGQWLVP